ncbi:MAG: PIN domain-containing protein [Gemmatimonadetes bacterium]|nr:PIN domain-containing protein [Gemmatimonadota bacterium]
MPGRPVLADAGPLYAAVDPDDQYHVRARDEMEVLNRERIGVAVAYSTFAEAYTLVLHRLGPRRAVRFSEELVAGAALLNPSPEDYGQALTRLAKHRDLRLSLFDGVAAILAERLGLALWTYDDHFHALGTPVWRAG